MAIEPEARRRAHQWREELYERTPEREALFETLSGHPIEPLYTAGGARRASIPTRSSATRASIPFTRGIYPSMYRGRLWTMRQFAGFGTVEETNERFRYLLDHGQHGLSTAFDMPTLMGLDSDHGRSLGEVGVEGVALDTVDDMATLFDAIPLDQVTVSMTINAPGGDPARLLRRRRGGEGDRRRAARRHDPDRHPQGVHRPEGVVLPDRPGDAAWSPTWSSGARSEMPRWHPISISGYHIREAGLDRPAGARVHAQGRLHLRRAGDRARPRRRRLRAAAVASSSTPTSTSSRRSPSTAPRAGSGRARCATPTAPATSARR